MPPAAPTPTLVVDHARCTERLELLDSRIRRTQRFLASIMFSASNGTGPRRPVDPIIRTLDSIIDIHRDEKRFIEGLLLDAHQRARN
jgi:hypothetical protein